MAWALLFTSGQGVIMFKILTTFFSIFSISSVYAGPLTRSPVTDRYDCERTKRVTDMIGLLHQNLVNSVPSMERLKKSVDAMESSWRGHYEDLDASHGERQIQEVERLLSDNIHLYKLIRADLANGDIALRQAMTPVMAGLDQLLMGGAKFSFLSFDSNHDFLRFHGSNRFIQTGPDQNRPQDYTRASTDEYVVALQRIVYNPLFTILKTYLENSVRVMEKVDGNKMRWVTDPGYNGLLKEQIATYRKACLPSQSDRSPLPQRVLAPESRDTSTSTEAY